MEDMLEQGQEVRQCIQGKLFEKQEKKAHLERELDELRADPTALRGLPHTEEIIRTRPMLEIRLGSNLNT